MTVWLPSILRFMNRNKKNAAQGSVDTVVSTVLPVPDEHLKLLKLPYETRPRVEPAWAPLVRSTYSRLPNRAPGAQDYE